MYELPEVLEVNGVEHPIRTDYRDILHIMYALNDPNLTDSEKAYVCLYDLYEDFNEIASEDYEAAFKAASVFLDCGQKDRRDVPTRKRMVDFEQDERLLIAAVNRAAGFEVRAVEYMHWWTFMGLFMEIGECTYSTVLTIRSKKARGKSLEKWEQEFYQNNRDSCDIKEKLNESDQDDYELIEAALALNNRKVMEGRTSG